MKIGIMKALLLLLLTCLFLISLQSCRDKDEPEQECTPDKTVYIPAILKDYFHFKEGSWWVYAYEHDTTIIDSFWVSVSGENFENNITRNHDYSKPFCFEFCGYSIQNKSTLDKEYYSSSGIVNSYGNEPNQAQFNVLDVAANGNYQYRITFSPDSSFVKIGPGNNITDLHQDTILFGRPYHEVIRCYYSGNPKQSDPYTEVLYARNIGKIQYTKQNGTTWYLVRYYIEQ
ncbi:MAG: hypothetical protein ACYC1Q_04435 [Bacteroidia bacterium]